MRIKFKFLSFLNFIGQFIGVRYFRKNLEGFTLMEQILVLALTTILVLIGFTAVLNINRLMGKVRENAAIDRSIYLLNQVIDNDIRNAETLNWDGALRCKKNIGPVSYAFEDSCLLRISEEATDSFQFVTSGLEIKTYKDNPHLVEQITFILSSPNQEFRMSFFKPYPEFKIMEEINHGN